MPRAHTWYRASGTITASRLRWLRGIALSTVVVASALVPRLWLHGVLEDRSAFILFTLAVMSVSALVACWLARSQRGSAYWLELWSFSVPHNETERLADITEILLFAVVGLDITWLAQQLHAASLRAADALEQVRKLTGLLPIRAWCKKIRDEEGRWQQLERYISLHSDAKFTQVLCEECGGRMEADRQALKWQPQQQFLPVSDALAHDNRNISNPAAAVGPPPVQ